MTEPVGPPVRLVWPSREYLASYTAALERGWSPNNVTGRAAAEEELQWIKRDPDGFIVSMVDRDAKGPLITMADGSTVRRIPGYRRWMWDGEFCASIGFRWQPGTEALPLTCADHIGYTVVPWKQRRGYATAALREILAAASAEGLRYVELVTHPGNIASQRVIAKNGGVLVEEFVEAPELGGRRALRYRVSLDRDAPRATNQ